MSLPGGWDPSYERKIVVLLMIGFGLVGLDRQIIGPLFPSMMKDLGLNYQDLGNLIGILGFSWGIFAIIGGTLSDKIGRRAIIVPAVIGFSLMAGISGLASGIGSLLAMRAIMGAAEGAYTPTSFVTNAEGSKPSRVGLNLGLQQSAFPLIGLGLGPIIATQLLQVVPSWRYVFMLVAVPGLVLAALLYLTIRDPVRAPVTATHPKVAVREIFRHRNVTISMIAIFCLMSGTFVIMGMIPNYLTDYLKFDVQQMGFIASAVGFGGFLGQIVLLALSDLLGRKPVLLLSFLGGGVCVYLFGTVGAANPVTLYALLFMTCFFSFAAVTIISGPIAIESAPPGTTASVTGVIAGAGEIFGGGVAPAIAGGIAQRFGIQYVVTVALVGFLAGLVVSLFIKETAPRKAGGRPKEAGLS